MGIWRDPLDELISDLERTLPSAPAFQDIPPQEDFCFWATRAILAREPLEKLRQCEDPRVRRVQAYWDRLPPIESRSPAITPRANRDGDNGED